MLTEIERAAIAKAASMPKGLPAGKHEVDILVHIKGYINKGEDYESSVYQSIPFDQLFAVAMSKLNAVTIESIVREALADEVDSSIVKDSVKDAIAKLTEASTKTCSGKTTAKLKAEKIESPTETAIEEAA